MQARLVQISYTLEHRVGSLRVSAGTSLAFVLLTGVTV